jgi:Fe-S-cluster containining protein
VEPQNPVPCIGCHTDCCESYIVPVTAHDIHRISRTLGVEPAGFLELHPLDAESGGVHIGEGFFQLALRRDQDGACFFLLKIGAERRCSIQSFKPRVCLVYPFTMDDEDKLWHRNDMLCPRPWSLTWQEQQETRATIRQMRAEIQFHDDLVARWNEAHPDGGAFQEYVDYMFSMVARSQGEVC